MEQHSNRHNQILQVQPETMPAKHVHPVHTEPPADVHLPGYTLIRKLGGGSQGQVFLAKRDSNGQEVAVKRLSIESVKSWKTYELFHREANVLSELQIPGVAHFYEAIDCVNEDPPCAWIVQEYIPGNTLAALIRAGHRFSMSCIFDIILQILKILKQLHSHTPPVIHRDIKPSNIMLKPLSDDRYQVFILDFGAVSNPQLNGKGGSTVTGTYGFMPPEQLMGKPTAASDIYALAAVAVNMLSGVSPAEMEVKAFRLIFEPYMQFMPIPIIDTLQKMLEPETAHRLYDYDVLTDLFEHFKKGEYTTKSIYKPVVYSPRLYDSKLKEVYSFAQAGNLELWQQLPDAVPRELPKSYAMLKIAPHNERLYFNNDSSIYDRSYKQKIEDMSKLFEIKGNHEMPGLGNFVSLIFMAIWFCIFYFTPLRSILKESTFLITIIIVFLGIICNYLLARLIAKLISKKYRFGNQSHKLENLMCAKFNAVLKKGRKTIATIISIEYQKIDVQRVEFHKKTQQYVVHDSPKFKVRYKFNPPDDSNPNDLIHEITVSEAPGESFKAGAPLPILYRIYNEKKNDIEHVDSIPFPLVLSDIESYTHILGRSSYY